MDEELKKQQEAEQPAPETEETAQTADEAVNDAPAGETEETPDPLAEAQEQLKAEQDKYLRLAAEYDNYRKRSQKEKDSLYRDGRADTIEKFLPVFDNLTLALAQETEDAAYKKGVEMTMNGLMEILKKMDVTVYGDVPAVPDDARRTRREADRGGRKGIQPGFPQRGDARGG